MLATDFRPPNPKSFCFCRRRDRYRAPHVLLIIVKSVERYHAARTAMPTITTTPAAATTTKRKRTKNMQ